MHTPEGPILTSPSFSPGFSSWTAKFLWTFTEPSAWIPFLLLFASLGIYYLWLIRRNRSSMKEVFVPVFRPPYGLSPAAVRYIWSLGFDTKCLIVGLMNASLKGCYRLRWDKKGFSALLTEDADMKRLSGDERSAFRLSAGQYRPRIRFSTRISAQAFRMGLKMEQYLSEKYGLLIDRKRKWFAAAVVLSLLGTLLIYALSSSPETLQMFFLFFLVMTGCVVVPALLLEVSLRDRYTFGAVVCLTYILAGIVGLVMIELRHDTPSFLPVMLPLAALHVYMFRRLPSHTRLGMHVMAELNAYRKYLRHAFSEIHDPSQLDEEKLQELPYVIALDLEEEFTPYFRKILSESQYSPYSFFES